MKGFFVVYILKLSNDKYYVGWTSDLGRRIKEHNCGKISYTSKHKPFLLVFYSAFDDQYVAIAFEKYLKSGSGRAFMRKRLINTKTGSWDNNR